MAVTECPVCGTRFECGETEVEPYAYKVMVDRMVEVRLLAEKMRRSSVHSERILGADLLQVVDGL